VWMGLYPAPFLKRLESSVQRIVLRVSPQYAAKYAECNTTPGALAASTNPAAKFLTNLPCDTPSTGSGQAPAEKR
jgi:hypothetical protein